MDFHLSTTSFSLDLLSQQTDDFFCANFEKETENLTGLKKRTSQAAFDMFLSFSEDEYSNSEEEDLEPPVISKDYEADIESDEEELKLANRLRPKKRVNITSSHFTPTHLDNLVYETLKKGFNKIKEMKQVRVFLNHHLETRYADYVFRLGLEGSS
jgi:hypothetical protein